MPKLIIAPDVRHDLLDIWDYIAPENIDAATDLIQEIASKFAFLQSNPSVGKSWEALYPNLRSFVVRRYLIFYRAEPSKVEILRVLHGARDVEAVLRKHLQL